MLIPTHILLVFLHASLAVDLTYYVKESQGPGTLVGDISLDTHLIDGISHQNNGLITFNLLQQGMSDTSQLFRVSKNTGKLYTTQNLDAELMCKREKECYKMIDVAVKKGTSFIKLLEIKVIIQDVNDHQPKFSRKEVNIQFSERDRKGIKISIPNAIDRDVGLLNSQITYQLKKNRDEPFTLSISERVDGTSDLSIILEDMLDREAKDAYVIQVIARDGGSPAKQSVLDVHILVTDINDNPPEFSQKVYNVSINNEPSRFVPVSILSAQDLDTGNNGKVSYQFSLKTSEMVKSHFHLNEETGEIFLRKKFSLGQEMLHNLYVEAIDGGSPPLSSLAKVLVNVISQQNNPPTININFVFASTANTTTISEDIEVGSFIAFVKVTDHDVGQNGEVRCDLQHDKFQLQSLGMKKYKVILKSPVDRETEDLHDIFITCQDKGSPPLHSKKQFSIKVIDVNDVRPQFFREIYRFSIDENQKSQIPVGFINASDQDLGAGGQLTYSLLTKDKQFLPFQIKEDGSISTLHSIDHEMQDMYEFQVLVKDNGKPPLNNTVNVIVEVRDENDNAPYFTFPHINPFTLDLVYYPHHTKNITILKASDRDSRENAFLKYEISSGNDKQLFTINRYTGLLSFTRTVTQQDAGSYDLEFVVKDSGTPVQSASTTIFLILTVSNKTFDVPKSVNKKNDDKINFNLVIIITLISVTVSVIITASMSICILRYCHQRNIPQGDETNTPHRCPNDQRHLMCPSYHTSSWPDVPAAVTHLTEPRKLSQSSNFQNIDYRGSPLKPQLCSVLSHQVSTNKTLMIDKFSKSLSLLMI